jgi:hypothetical protein
MTLASKILLTLSTVLLFSATQAQAYITPGGPRPAPYPGDGPRPAPYPDPGVQPGPQFPPEPRPFPRQDNISLQLNVYSSLSSNDRLDLSSYIDSVQYQGYRITEIDITANPSYSNSLINLVINGFNVGQTMEVDSYQTVAAYPDNAIIGQNASSIVLYTQGDMTITGVTLQLSR